MVSSFMILARQKYTHSLYMCKVIIMFGPFSAGNDIQNLSRCLCCFILLKEIFILNFNTKIRIEYGSAVCSH